MRSDGKRGERNMELNPGYVMIKTDEYKDLIETSFYQEEILHENEQLKKQVKDYQFQILESKINIFSLRNGKPENVIDVTSSWFPFDREFLEKTDIPLKDIIEFVKHKKEEQYRQIEERKEENHE